MSLSELRDLGVTPMDDEAIAAFLTAQGVGVLALPDAGEPYVLPLSFGYDGEDALYFTYVLGEDSEKARLSERADTARFLVYAADSPFHWQSVLLTGTIEAVPRDGWDDLALENAWRPALFEEADLSGGIAVYRFEIAEREGFRHTGLPPGFED
jgi:nitroimidazol reductase NimA-like FMN-containing flavoprotein (pyridoxamine 5'-phosphate oxidase superfamily)